VTRYYDIFTAICFFIGAYLLHQPTPLFHIALEATNHMISPYVISVWSFFFGVYYLFDFGRFSSSTFRSITHGITSLMWVYGFAVFITTEYHFLSLLLVFLTLERTMMFMREACNGVR